MRIQHLTPIFKYIDGSMDLYFQFLIEKTTHGTYWTSLVATVNDDFEVLHTSWRNDINHIQTIQEELNRYKIRMMLKESKNMICVNSNNFWGI